MTSTEVQRLGVLLGEATTPAEFMQNLATHQSGGGSGVAVITTVNGKPVTSLDEILANPDGFEVSVQAGIRDDWKQQMNAAMKNKILGEASLMQAAQMGDPQAQSIVQQRVADKARTQRAQTYGEMYGMGPAGQAAQGGMGAELARLATRHGGSSLGALQHLIGNMNPYANWDRSNDVPLDTGAIEAQRNMAMLLGINPAQPPGPRPVDPGSF